MRKSLWLRLFAASTAPLRCRLVEINKPQAFVQVRSTQDFHREPTTWLSFGQGSRCRYTRGMLVCCTGTTIGEGVQDLRALVGFGSVVLPVGYLFSLVCRRPSSQSWRERALWTVSLGLPLAVALSVWGQRLLPRVIVDVLFGALLLLAVGTGFVLARRLLPNATMPAPSRQALWGLGALAVIFALYCLSETLDIQIGHRLYLSTLITDWSPRMAMVGGALRSGVPPINGLSTLSPGMTGIAPHLRYYYFWYVLVAQVATLVHVGAQPALAASCVWAGWGFLAAILLALRYMLDSRQPWARAGLVLCLLLAVLGLDLIPTALMWISPTHHPLMEMEWWRPDRTPSFLGMVLASPHHVAGFCSLLCGTLLLLLLGRSTEQTHRPRRAEVALTACGTGLLFATASGLSLFPTLCFAIGLSFWSLDLLRRRDWHSLAGLAGSGLVALLLAHSYLRELSSGASAATGFLGFAWRSYGFAATELARFGSGYRSPLRLMILRQGGVAMLDFMELGFYLFVLIAAIRDDLLRPGRLSRGRCLWWALLLGAGIPAYFLSSTATSGPNDLGFDAGFLFRLCLQLWAVEWVRDHWSRRAAPKALWQRMGFVTALCLAVLGVAAQVYQVLSIRLYFPLIGSGWIHKQADILTQDHLSERLYNIQAAMKALDRAIPPSRPDTEAVQFNPIGPLLAPEVYFNTHQVASWDAGCGTSFGGDYSHCAPIYQSLLFLYGNTEAGMLRSRALNTFQDGAAARVATAEDLAAVCRALKLRAVIADATDSIWSHPNSWVWTGPVLVANSTVRAIGCPAGAPRP